jgi:hypothetical protein
VHAQMPQQARDVAGCQQALGLLKLLSHAHTVANSPGSASGNPARVTGPAGPAGQPGGSALVAGPPGGPSDQLGCVVVHRVPAGRLWRSSKENRPQAQCRFRDDWWCPGPPPGPGGPGRYRAARASAHGASRAAARCRSLPGRPARKLRKSVLTAKAAQPAGSRYRKPNYPRIPHCATYPTKRCLTAGLCAPAPGVGSRSVGPSARRLLAGHAVGSRGSRPGESPGSCGAAQ